MSLADNRYIYSEEHHIFRKTIRRFFAEEFEPNIDRWEDQRSIDRAFWRKAGKIGILNAAIASEYGGGGGDFLHKVVLSEELGYCPRMASAGSSLDTDIISFYIEKFGTAEQKRQWLPRISSGEIIVSVAMTEPQTGSDLANIRTAAVCDGDDYVINGSKIYISHGIIADLIIVACKTSPELGARGISLFLVETDRAGFRRGRNLRKMGMSAGDTAELFFEDVRVPASNLLGVENQGFKILTSELARERILNAARSLGAAYAAFELTVAFVKDRIAFGQKVIEFQNTQFVLADTKTELMVGRAFLDECLLESSNGIYDKERAAMAKLWMTEMEGRVMDRCVQLHGGAGYMDEYPISKMFTAARVHRIYAGSSEIMRTVIGRSI